MLLINQLATLPILTAGPNASKFYLRKKYAVMIHKHVGIISSKVNMIKHSGKVIWQKKGGVEIRKGILKSNLSTSLPINNLDD